MEIIIRQAKLDDLDAIVKIHNSAFTNFFLTSLGDGFLKLYYQSVMRSKYGIILISESDCEVIGFCAGTLLSAGFNTRLIKENLFNYMWQSVKLLFTSPISILHLYKNLTKENPDVGDNGDYAELLSIGVDPNNQGGGAGKKMLIALEEEVQKKGGLKLSLTTDYEDNEKAIGFYHSLGYNEWYDFVTFPNRRMYRMIKQIV